MAPQSPHIPEQHGDHLGLVLSGGGARGAYQAGAIQALYEIAHDCKLRQPFPVLTGVSAGAINIAYLASTLDHPLDSTKSLSAMWSSVHTDDIFRTDIASLSFIAWEWIRDIATGTSHETFSPRALLNTDPLAQLLGSRIKFKRIAEHLRHGLLDSVSVTAMNYATAESLVFYQSRTKVAPWERSRRRGMPVNLEVEHVMASSAIPLFFPPIALEGSYFADGSLRNMAPLSSALHLGATRIIAISVQNELPVIPTACPLPRSPECLESTPSVARILTVLIDGALMDAIEVDLERLTRINRTLTLMSPEQRMASKLRVVPHIHLQPSKNIGEMAQESEQNLPQSIRFLLRGLGPLREGADLLSYLMFEPSYCARLVALGYQDTISRHDEIADFYMLDVS